MVVSGGSSSGRGLSVDRFYCPPAMRRQLEKQRQQQLQQQETTLPKPVKAKPRPDTPPVPAPAPSVDARVIESRAESVDSSKPSVSSSSSSASTSPSPSPSPPPRTIPSVGNLDRLLQSTTPIVPAQYISKTNMRCWRKSNGMESCPYFTLGDLWESFREWSAYGAGVPLLLNGSDCVVQYYVPYLSGIQLYMGSSRTTLRSRLSGEESIVEMYQNTSSDASSESEADRAVRKRRESLLSSSYKDQRDHLGEENDASNQTILPVFEYLEHDPPYGREPLADKISLLANKFPQLKTYRSCDLLPSSWISVAWYPIYRIPIGPTLKDLDACFLTFHSLSTPLKNSCNRHPEMNGSVRIVNKLSLPIFGLASYKFKGSVWINNELDEQQLTSSLLESADNWLKLLKVDHPDFRFFFSHYNTNLR